MSQMDVKTAFLNNELENEIFMFILEGVIGKEELEKNYVGMQTSKNFFWTQKSSSLVYI